MSFQDVLTTPSVAPSFLLGVVGKLKLRLFGATIDQITGEPAVNGKSGYAAEVANPTKCDPSALPYIGKDWLITQGPAEATAAYRVRLQQAPTTWQKFAGNDWGILLQTLSQVIGVNGATAPRVRCVDNTSAWNWFEAGADTTQPPWHQYPNSANWLWDNTASAPDGPNPAGMWWRFWLIIESVVNPFASQWPALGTGGQPTLGNSPSASLGFSNVAPSFWTNLRAVLETFRADHAWLRWILVTFAPQFLDPNITAGGNNPDGTWGIGYKIVSGQYEASTPTEVALVPGTPASPLGAPNYVSNQPFGYKIVSGQYQAWS